MKHRDQAHEFALYMQRISEQKVVSGQLLHIEDEALVHRISRVLRLNEQDKVILFDAAAHAYGRIHELHKHNVSVSIDAVHQNVILQPHISLWLPILKREAFEEALYSAVELGATEIQLMLTAKMQRHWKNHEMERIEHIMIAAAEQSKHFALPKILEPVELPELVPNGKTFFFDPQGDPLLEVLNQTQFIKPEQITLIVGPEGDLTETEKFHLQQHEVQFVRLTPTVLRAQQAVAVALGAFRSVV